jgi:hypothetical protein
MDYRGVGHERFAEFVRHRLFGVCRETATGPRERGSEANGSRKSAEIEGMSSCRTFTYRSKTVMAREQIDMCALRTNGSNVCLVVAECVRGCIGSRQLLYVTPHAKRAIELANALAKRPAVFSEQFDTGYDAEDLVRVVVDKYAMGLFEDRVYQVDVQR